MLQAGFVFHSNNGYSELILAKKGFILIKENESNRQQRQAICCWPKKSVQCCCITFQIRLSISSPISTCFFQFQHQYQVAGNARSGSLFRYAPVLCSRVILVAFTALSPQTLLPTSLFSNDTIQSNRCCHSFASSFIKQEVLRGGPQSNQYLFGTKCS